MMYERSQYSALDELALLAMANAPTVRVKALVLPKPALRDTEPMLLPVDSLDSLGRSYLAYTGEWDASHCSLWEDTVYQVERLVRRYLERMGCYPDEILLSLQRYRAMPEKVKSYWPYDKHTKPITYGWEWRNVNSYEVLVRGKVS